MVRKNFSVHIIIFNILTLAVALFPTTALSAEKQCPAPVPAAKVLRVYRLDQGTLIDTVEQRQQLAAKQKLPRIQLGDRIALEIDGLANLWAYASCNKGLVMTIDDRPISNLIPTPPLDPAKNILNFDLELGSDASRKDWVYHLGNPNLVGRTVLVSVAPVGEPALRPGSQARLVSVPKRFLFIWAILFALIFICFVVLANKSDVLRVGPLSTNPQILANAEKLNNNKSFKSQYSLARVQAAWWFFVVLAAFLLIGIVTGDFTNALNASALGLLGIGSGTLAGSAAIDSAQTGSSSGGTVAQAADIETLIENNNLNGLKKAIGASRNFIFDIVSDAKGVAFHRFQVVAWTVVLTAIFIYEVYRSLAMPDFNTLLGVQTLSVLTYLGLKIPEPKPSVK